MELYTANNIHTLECAPGDHTCTFLSHLVANGISPFVDNIKGELLLVKTDQHLLPILVASGSYRNSYVCSPYIHYITVGIESLSTIKNPLFRLGAYIGLRTLGLILRTTSVNRTLYINHWFLSTDLHAPTLSSEEIKTVTNTLKERYPGHAIIMRSLNAWTTSRVKRHLNDEGFDLIASRHIYLSHIHDEEVFNNRIVKSDLKLWEEAACEVIDQANLKEEDFERVAELCRILAIDHHSRWNPKVTTKLLRQLHRTPAITLKGLKKDGQIIGIIGYQIDSAGVLTCTLFGYDKNHPEQNTHYRLVSTLLYLEARQHAKLFHQSAGGSYFKRSRGAKGFTEYQAAFTQHLGLRQRIGWSILKKVINTFAPSLMKDY